MKRKSKILNKPVRTLQVPATAEMLYEMEGRLIHKMDSGFHQMRSEFDSKFGGMKSEFNGMKSEIGGMKSEISGMKSELHRVALLVEEQNARNKYVLDGYTQLYDLIASRSKA